VVVVERMRARPRPSEQVQALFADGWPAFIGADPVAARYDARAREFFADLELAVLDDGLLVAAGWAVALSWSGAAADLPAGYSDALARAVEGRLGGVPPDTLMICGAQVLAGRRGRGLAGVLMAALRDSAGPAGLARVIAPVRPTSKARYPLIPIERFAEWTRGDGAPFDPWVRTHARMGATIIGTAPRSQVMTGTVAQWEGWTGLPLPGNGRYVIPEGLSPLIVDRDRDIGEYAEPNIWIRHR
jgi:GNAT superfamily N-acetyltransferase